MVHVGDHAYFVEELQLGQQIVRCHFDLLFNVGPEN